MDTPPKLLPHAALVTALALAVFTPPAAAGPPALASVEAAGAHAAAEIAYDGVVEAVRQTVVAAQVPGAVVSLQARAGDRVKAGQVLLRLEAHAAEQQAGAAAAQAQAARAAQEVAAREFERQQQLYRQDYISRAALDRAEAQHKSAQAEAAAQLAAAGAARTQSGFYVVKAPYDGIVADVAVAMGEMAMPGRPLLTLYDPAALRVTATVPQSAAPRPDGAPAVELPGGSAGRMAPLRSQVLPTADPATHTVELRLELPPGTIATPGTFARVWLAGVASGRVSVPARAVVRRAELTGVYVIGSDGRPLLRQVRLARAGGEQVEVLTGLHAGERVALDPQAAAQVR